MIVSGEIYADGDHKDGYKKGWYVLAHNHDTGASCLRVEKMLDQLLGKADTQKKTLWGFKSDISNIN